MDSNSSAELLPPAAHESFMRGQTYRRDSKERAPELTGGHAFNRCFALAPDVCVR
jgi:hypothetical protein